MCCEHQVLKKKSQFNIETSFIFTSIYLYRLFKEVYHCVIKNCAGLHSVEHQDLKKNRI